MCALGEKNTGRTSHSNLPSQGSQSPDQPFLTCVPGGARIMHRLAVASACTKPRTGSACIYSRTQGREKATNSVTAMLHHPLPETAQSIRGKKRSQSTTWLRGRKTSPVFQTFSAPVVALALISCQIQGRAASRQGKVENRALLQ